MLRHCRARPALHWLAIVIVALACTGFRISELAALRWSDLDLRSRTILLTPDGEIGFEHGRLHSFHHYFCSQAFVGGASELDIRDWLGHKVSKMVAPDRHLGDKESYQKMERIGFLGCGDRAERSHG